MRGMGIVTGLTLGGCGGRTVAHEEVAVAADDVRPEARVLYDAVDGSVHELVTCGGAQRSFVMPLALRVVASADGLLDPEAQDTLEEYGEWFGLDGVGFVQEGAAWRLPMNGTEFSVRFLDGEVPITADPFVLDSYVRGAVAESDRTWDELLAAPEEPTTFTFRWEEEGELAHLLSPLTNPIVVRASLVDLALLAFGFGQSSTVDLGSFDGLGDLRVVGDVPFVDTVGAVTVGYDARIEGDARALASGGSAALAIDGLSATYGEWSIEAVSIALTEVPGGLAGAIVFAVQGPDADYEATADFGGGAAYPLTSWLCTRGCPGDR